MAGTEEPTTPVVSRRRRWLIVAGAGLVIVVTAIAALAFRTDDTKPSVHVATQSPSTDAPTTTRPTTTTTQALSTTTTVPTTKTTIAATRPNSPIAAPPTTAPTNVIPPATLVAAPISVLQWSGPTALSLATNAKKDVSVAAHNPSTGTVSLPHPLSCAPTLQHDEVCPQMVQMIVPGATARASFVVDATNVAPGSYTLSIEGVRNITVTVTPA